jgi:O-antigen/teichoic acid export membrane protein
MKVIFKNFSFLIASQLIYKILSFFSFILLARVLGVDQFGLLSYAISFVYLFDFITDFGISTIMVRDASGEPKEKLGEYFSDVFFLKIFLSLATYLFIGLSVFLINKDPLKIKIILLLGCALIFDSFSNTLRYIFNILEKMYITSFSTILEAILKFVLVLFFIYYYKYNLSILAQLFLLTSVAIFFLNMVLVQGNLITIHWSYVPRLWLHLLQLSIPVAFLAFFQSLNFRINIIMLSKMTNDVVTGIYSAGSKIIESIGIIPFTFSTALLPTISRFAKIDRNSFITSFKYCVFFIFLISLPVALVLFTYAKQISLFLLGKDFIASATVIKISAFLLIPFFIRPTLEYFALARVKSSIIYFSSIVGIAANIIMNILLIPNLNYIGSCISIVVAEFIISLILLFRVRRLMKG